MVKGKLFCDFDTQTAELKECDMAFAIGIKMIDTGEYRSQCISIGGEGLSDTEIRQCLAKNVVSLAAKLFAKKDPIDTGMQLLIFKDEIDEAVIERATKLLKRIAEEEMQG